MPDVSIVIVSWNTKKILSDCLESLDRCQSKLGLEVIVVDNASSDGTAEYLQKGFPNVRLVQNTANLGFAKANNIGLKLCSGQYVCLINSDVVVPEGCLGKMVEYMRQNPGIGMLGPKMRLRDGSVGHSCMRFPTVWNSFCRALALDSLFKGTGFCGGQLMNDFGYDRTLDVDVLTGWFWMVRREALAGVGLLDERFFMYGEDIDWSRRFHEAGWRVVFLDETEAFHYCGASSAVAPSRFYIEMNRANMQYYRTYHNTVAVIGLWLATWFHQIVRILGYGAMFILRPSGRLEAITKLTRSMACLFWLMGIRSARV